MAQLSNIQGYLLKRQSPTYAAYYNGKMSYRLHGKGWEKYVADTFDGLDKQQTSENIYKDVIDLYAANLVPTPGELSGFANLLVPLLSRGEAPALVDPAGEAFFPEHYEMVSDGKYTVAAVFTRSLEKMEDYVTFAYSDGKTELWVKPVPDDLTPADREGYTFHEARTGFTLYRFALDDKGFGGALSALQDRVNHSIIDQTVIAEMYARPFWYLLNYQAAPSNPYLPPQAQPSGDALKEEKPTGGAAGRIFTSSGEGPFGQLDPPTLSDMVAYHDSIIAKVSQSTGIPEFYFKPGGSQAPSGVALKVLSRRFNNKVARIRDDLEEDLRKLADQLGAEKGPNDEELVLWDSSDDLLQESMDAHGLALAQMGYPLDYIAEVVTPGVDLDDYMDDGFAEMTPDQIAAYASNPGQRAGQPAINPIPLPQQTIEG